METKKFLIAIMLVAIFIFIVSFSSLYAERTISCSAAQTCTIPIPYLIPITSSMGLFIGTLIYYLLASQIKKKERNITEYSNLIEKFLTKEEKQILQILSKNQSISQAKLASQTNFPRLKIFRIIEKLKQKEIIEKQEDGKARFITLKPEIKEILKSL